MKPYIAIARVTTAGEYARPSQPRDVFRQGEVTTAWCHARHEIPDTKCRCGFVMLRSSPAGLAWALLSVASLYSEVGRRPELRLLAVQPGGRVISEARGQLIRAEKALMLGEIPWSEPLPPALRRADPRDVDHVLPLIALLRLAWPPSPVTLRTLSLIRHTLDRGCLSKERMRRICEALDMAYWEEKDCPVCGKEART